MSPTERTPLTRPSDVPSYVEFSSLLRNRRMRVRQLQCCVCATFIVIFVMALVASVSYSMRSSNAVTNVSATSGAATNLLKSVWVTSFTKLVDMDESSSDALTDEELQDGIIAGKQAIEERRVADEAATPLSGPSPNSRHQYAVSTSVRAGELALIGVGELAATKKIEEVRILAGKSFPVGTALQADWIPTDTCREFSRINCTSGIYRTFDGTCNHPEQKGASLTAFKRILPPDYADGINAPRKGKLGKELPSAREVSLLVHPPSPSTNPSFTVMLAVFGQFLDHDITATAISQGQNGSSLSCCPPSNGHPECFPVEVGPGDPVYDIAGSSCMEFVRSASAPQCKIGPRQQLNQVSAFIDGSAIYGPDVSTSRDLRSGVGGLLRMQTTSDNRTLLPASTNLGDGCNRELEFARGRYCFATGDGRANENLHLTTMHLLWARQHNRIAKIFADMNPFWDDEKLYQETRRVIGAQLQHITYREFIPIILGERETILRNLKPLTSGYRGNYNSEVDPSIANNFAAAAFRFAHTLLPGLMRVTDAEKGTSSYLELHRMLFNPYSLYFKGGVESSINSATSNVIQKTSTHVTSQLTRHLFEDPMGNVSVPCGLDLVSLNIQRGRDHGLPGYTKWREFCGLSKPATFLDLSDQLDSEALDQISKLYRYVDDIDLYTGALAELPASDGLLGPTFTCLISHQFVRLQQGDRYWYETPDQPHSFTEGQLKEVRKSSLAKLICDCSDEVTEIQPEVMRSIGVDNPMLSCEDIPGPSLNPWKDTSFTLSLTGSPVFVDWMNFKNDINDTVQGIISVFGVNKPPPGSADWLSVQDMMNKSFAELRDQLAGLHPKPKLASDLKLPQYAEVQKFMNDSLKDAEDHALRLGNETAVIDDWISFKANIMKSVNDTVNSIKGSIPSTVDWLAFKENIKSQFADIKSQLAGIKVKPVLKVSDNPTDTADWTQLKIDIIKSVNDAVDSIKINMPPPNDPAWATFMSKIKDQFASIKDRIPTAKGNLKISADSSAAMDDWISFKNNIITSLSDTIMAIKDNMPPPGDPAWITFRDKIKDQFAGIKNGIPIMRPSVPVESMTDSAITVLDDWINFKNEIINSVDVAVQKIKDNMPPPGDPTWATYRNQVTAEFVDLKNKIPVSKTKPALKATPVAVFDWIGLKNKINKTVSDLIDNVNSGTLAPGDPKWVEFRDYINKSFSDLQNDVIALRPKPSGVKLLELKSDWLEFKNEINKSLTTAIDHIKVRSALSGDAARMSFGDTVKDQFADIKNEIATIKAEWLSKVQADESKGYKPDKAKIKDVVPVNVLPQDLQSLRAFKDFTNNSFSEIKRNIAAFKPDPTTPVIPEAEWLDFKNELNATLMDLIKITNHTDPTAWLNFKASMSKYFTDLKNEIISLQNITKLQDDAAGGGKKPKTKTKSKVSKNKVINKDNSTKGIDDFDWDDFQAQISMTVNNLFNDVSLSVPSSNDPKSGSLQQALVEARDKFENLNPAPILKAVPDAPTDWARFMRSINKTISDVVTEIQDLKPSVDDPSMDEYEDSVHNMFDELQDIIQGKRDEIENLASSSSPLISVDFLPYGNRLILILTLSVIKIFLH
ncbi:uncharacterized protein LOC107267540 isoform X2 [Cephus cinctus]|uniref:Uncharacterized protein LOC107267540 isoform X2 n=1 Tax=Cephus cinctus TaxID=211228 RepID=A0AAJ7RGP2_CEPCN|nr:uncharacterized protein LOC107267540 isoform X2 [Cephus cinctus]